jgi:hypothetical protein
VPPRAQQHARQRRLPRDSADSRAAIPMAIAPEVLDLVATWNRRPTWIAARR